MSYKHDIARLAEIEQQIASLESSRSDIKSAMEDRLRGCGHYFHGGLNGVDCVDELVEFLAQNKDWILELMGWKARHDSTT
jgi:hypothetical protein